MERLATDARSRQAAFPLLAIGVAAVVLLGTASGAVRIPLAEIPGMLFGGFARAAENAHLETVLWQLRLPRVALALLVGATLAVCGALMQGLFRNPLADPGLVGVSSGASLGAVVALIFASFLPSAAWWIQSPAFLPASAFVGALAITILITRLGSKEGRTDVALLLLAGLGINALVGALIGLATFVATDAQLRSLAFWTLGSLGGADWKLVATVLPVTLVVAIVGQRLANALNAFALGEACAGHLGFSVENTKRALVGVVAIGVAVCVAFTGLIGFIGLVVPHLVRLWIGPDHRWLLPASALLGAILLTAADTLARTLAAPAEIPIGILTAILGAPFFVGMLAARRKSLA